MSPSGQGRWLSPNDQWPRHTKPWFRRALDKARRGGWWYKLGGHGPGLAYCSRPHDVDFQPCVFPVFSTGAAGESAAKELEARIARCPHAGADAANTLAVAASQMDKVELLITATEALLDHADREQESAELFERAQHLLDEAVASIDQIDELMSMALTVDREARAAADEAEATLLAAESSNLRDPELVIEAAEELTSQVRTKVREAPPSIEARELRLRVRIAQTKLKELRARAQRS